MPTGYTAAIADGISLRQFILSCARGMGACIMQRDDTASDLPKKREPTDYHAERIVKAEATLAETKSMPDDVAETKAAEDYTRRLESIESSIRKNNDLKVKYESMLARVRSWNPPTVEHQGLKDFMVRQITESIKFDCGDTYHEDALEKLKRLSGQEWKNGKIQQALSDLNYHQREHNKEVERCREQHEWIDQLYEALPE